MSVAGYSLEGLMTDKKDFQKRANDAPMEEIVRKVAHIGKRPLKKEGPQEALPMEGEIQNLVFNDKTIRQVFHDNEWYFSIVDVIEAVTESGRARQYWHDLKTQLSEKEGFSELSGKIGQLRMPSPDGKAYLTDAVNVETLFRIIQSVPSPKAEPFKRWLAKVGYERIEEFQNPEIGVKRAMLYWRLQGRSDDWIEARLRAIVVRHELTSEWSKRGVVEGRDFGYLTNLISKETFNLRTDEHRSVKGLSSSHNLRDHMTDLELILTMLGEKSTSTIAQSTNARGLEGNAVAAVQGGRVAGTARKTLEAQLGKPVVSRENFLKKPSAKPLPK